VLDLLRTFKPRAKAGTSNQAAFTFIDLFAGIGGLRLGFETIGGKCVFTCEWDRYSQATYRANFPDDDHEIAGDIRDVDLSDILAHDVLLAGFSCQPFSIAGVSKKNALHRPHGFACEAQGTLFFHLAKIIEHCKPRTFLLENVKNLVNHDQGHTFRTIHDILHKQLGYRVQSRIVDAKPWVPQHRERIFTAGFHPDAEDSGFTFDNMEIPNALARPKLKDIHHPESGEEESDHPFTGKRRSKVADKYMLRDHLWRYLRDYAKKHRAKGNGFGFGLFGIVSRGVV